MLVSAMLLVVSAGCQREAPITTYVIPTKMPSVLASEDSRMIAAIVPQGDQAWFFKILGPKSAVDTVDKTFRRFAEDVAFENGKPVLSELPAGWQRGGEKQMRYASIDIDTPDKQLDLSISQLAIMEDWDDMVRRNVNRWRGQVGLKDSDEPFGGAELLRPKKDPADEGKPLPIWFDETGSADPGVAPPMTQPPFAAGPVGNQDPLVDPHAGLPHDAQEAVAQAKAAAATESKTESPQDPRLSFDTPDGWRPGRMSTMRMAALAVGPDESAAEITVIIAGGDLRGNVARWMGQVAGSQPDDAAVDRMLADVEERQVDGRDAQRFVILPDAENAAATQAIDATIVPLENDFSLFIKMTGPPDIVSQQSDQMETFLDSLRFRM